MRFRSRELRDWPHAPTSGFAIVWSPVFLWFIWSDGIARKAFGWFWLLMFAVALPLLSAVMMHGR